MDHIPFQSMKTGTRVTVMGILASSQSPTSKHRAFNSCEHAVIFILSHLQYIFYNYRIVICLLFPKSNLGLDQANAI